MVPQGFAVARKVLGIKGLRRHVNNIANLIETLCSVRVSASFLAFVTVVMNVKVKTGMIQIGTTAIELSDMTQGAEFNFVLAKFIYPGCVQLGWRLNGIIDDDPI